MPHLPLHAFGFTPHNLYTAKGSLRVAVTAHACADDNVMERTTVYLGKGRRQSIGSPST